MKEEEILRKAKDFILFMNDVIENHLDYDYEENKTAYEDKELVQGLLDLFEKEKEKNKKKDIIINLYKTMYNEIIKENKENG